MVEPILSLAVTMHRSKGVFALLLGSGISRASGIPTGWEITQELIRRLAALKGESCEPEPDAWFHQTFGLAPGYSELLGQVARTSAERSQILKEFFEPTEEQRSEGLKAPSAAHHAIAGLVSRGYIRVVITTNFDRLLEQALTQAGIQPVIVSSADGVKGAPPLAHTTCTVIKINGDYLDGRLRNTSDELKNYEQEMNVLLDQVFDEYGLIITGWSADWDVALRGAIERANSRRFATYWTTRGALSTTAEQLASLRAAIVVPIKNADAFYMELDDKVIALENLSIVDPLPPKVAVARLKRYLSDDSLRISLGDLLHTETESVKAAIDQSPFTPQGQRYSGPDILSHLKLHEAQMSVCTSLMACGGYWARPNQIAPFLRAFKRIAEQKGTQSGIVYTLKMARYPALVLLYASGIAALANGNHSFLHSLLYATISVGEFEAPKHVADLLHNQGVMEPDIQRLLPGREREHTPLSNHLLLSLREALREYLPNDSGYEETFDYFEYLLCLTHADQKNTLAQLKESAEDPKSYVWGPAGRFAWRWGHALSQKPSVAALISEEKGALLRAGFFAAANADDDTKYLLVKNGVDRLAQLIRNQWHVF